MQTFSRLWQYLAKLFLEWAMFRLNVVEEIEKHILCSITFFRKSCNLWANVEKFGGATDVTDDNIRVMHFACWVTKATRERTRQHASALSHTQKYVILVAFPRQQWFLEGASMLRYTYIACLVTYGENPSKQTGFVGKI